MKWSEIIGQEQIKKNLQDSIKDGRVSHAQLFIGKSGYGMLLLAMAYASEIICNLSAQCYKQVDNLQHPDLHFSFPTINEGTKKALSKNYMNEFREFILKNPYQDQKDWYQFLEAQNKQGIINVEEIESVLHDFSLKSFEGGYKIQIIWMADKMNIESSNKLLKLLEEPPLKTMFILITEDESALLQTIISRCQISRINRIDENEIKKTLINKNNLDEEKAVILAKKSEGDWNKVLKLLSVDNVREEFEDYFIRWNRYAFIAKKDIRALKDLVNWSTEISLWGREKQKNFLEFCSETFRQALLYNYGARELVNDPLTDNNFKWGNFSQFISGNNIELILEEINDTFYHIERNANPKIVLLDMSIKLTRFLALR